MIQVYTGNGKGKTTAAIGLAVRAAGHGFRVRIIQFVKGNTFTGELEPLERLGIELRQFGRTCSHADKNKKGETGCGGCIDCWIDMEIIRDADRAAAAQAWQLARESVLAGFDLVVLDEFIVAVNKGLIPLGDAVEWLGEIPHNVELVLTGRNAPLEIIRAADLVSEIKMVKHPYQKGIEARKGIEY